MTARIGYKRTLVACCILYAFPKIIFWRADSFADFLAERAILSVVLAGFSGCDSAYLYLCAGGENAQSVFGWYDAAGMAGPLSFKKEAQNMNMTRKTFYGVGVASSLLNLIGGALLLFGIRLSLLFSFATIGGGAMMLLVAMSIREDQKACRLCLAGALLTVLGMAPGAVGAVCAAASWPVFAWQHFQSAPPESDLRRTAFLVMFCGLVLLVGSFLPVPQMLAACIIIAVAAAQGLFAFLLYSAAA